jgi:hypothetical protein
MGVEMAGYGYYERRVCTEVLDPLYARALYLECAGTELVLITADVITVDLETHQAVARELKQRCGLDERHLMICASHTHSGPATQLMIACGERDARYLATLREAYVKVALDARAAAIPSRIGATRQPVHGVGVNREQSVGPIDTAAQLLRVDHADGTPLVALYNFGAHPVVRYAFTSRISADWPGLVEAHIRAQMPGAVPMFLQGACGNINGHELSFDRTDPERNHKLADSRVADVALRLTQQILPALKTIETRPFDGQLQVLWKMIELPCVPEDVGMLQQTIRENQTLAESRTLTQLRPLHERLTSETQEERDWRTARWNVDWARHQLELIAKPPHVRAAPVQLARIGDIVLVGWPAEVFVELGIELRQRSPFPMTFVATFANDTAGYIPTEAAYESKGRGNEFGRYPREFAPHLYAHLPYRRDVGRVLVESTLEMLNAVAR